MTNDVIPLSKEELDFLLANDSPTIANAIEKVHLRDRTDGYIGGLVRSLSPELGTMVGHALTVTMDNSPGPVADREGHWRMWRAVEKLPRPVVIVVQDTSGQPSRCAYFGEVMASIAAALGVVGVVSDGGLRDLDEVRALGLRYFAPFAVVSHGNFRIDRVGSPVTIDGQHIETGDILHGDVNGIVIVPRECLDRLPATVDDIRARERQIIDTTKRADFSLDLLRTVGNY